MASVLFLSSAIGLKHLVKDLMVARLRCVFFHRSFQLLEQLIVFLDQNISHRVRLLDGVLLHP